MGSVPEVGQRAQRKLAAILVADVVGYSRLVSQAETATIARVKTVFVKIALPLLTRHGGRVVKTTGDGLLAEFASAVDAVACAQAVQRAIAEAEADRPTADRITARVGISLGEVVDDGGDLFGEQVNIAARLQALAPPGGLCVSGAVHDHVAGRVDVTFHDDGECMLRNIARPVRVYHTGPDGHALAPIAGEAGAADRVAIAVLPFENLGGEPEKDYLADGIAEDIILALSKFRWFFVTARSSSFVYRGREIDPRQVARELGVRFILEGSLRWAGAKLRISARLIDAEAGRQLWSERYDRTIEDIFSVQDEITESIVVAVEPEIEDAEVTRALRKQPERLDAWDCYYRASWHFHQTNKADNERAKALYRQSIALDPNFARGCAGLGYALYADAVFGYTGDPVAAVAEGLEHARHAVALDGRDPFARHTLGRLLMLRGDHDASIAELSRAITLNPNLALAHYGLGFSMILAGQPAEGIPHLERACRLSPNDPLLWAFYTVRALGHLVLDHVEEAVFWSRRAIGLSNAEFWAFYMLAGALGAKGDPAAVPALAEALGRRPDFDISMFDRNFRFVDPAHRQKYVDGITAAEIAWEAGGRPDPADA